MAKSASYWDRKDVVERSCALRLWSVFVSVRYVELEALVAADVVEVKFVFVARVESVDEMVGVHVLDHDEVVEVVIVVAKHGMPRCFSAVTGVSSPEQSVPTLSGGVVRGNIS